MRSGRTRRASASVALLFDNTAPMSSNSATPPRTHRKRNATCLTHTCTYVQGDGRGLWLAYDKVAQGIGTRRRLDVEVILIEPCKVREGVRISYGENASADYWGRLLRTGRFRLGVG